MALKLYSIYIWIIIAVVIPSLGIVLPTDGHCYEAEELSNITAKAESGDGKYQGLLGAICRRGDAGAINYEKAFEWLTLAAEQNDPIGLYNLAVMYESGQYVPKDTAKARELYVRSYEPMLELANRGNYEAQVNLGNLIEMGAGVEPDLQEALKWYEKAAEGDYPNAQYVIGYKYYYGWGYDKDYAKAEQWLKRAAEHDYPAAMNLLANMYANGTGVVPNYDSAVQLFRKAELYRNNYEEITADSGLYVLNGIAKYGDKVIANLLPPPFKLEIPEGSCGEACLWSIINSKKFQFSQLEINDSGGKPGRGLHSYELYQPLQKNGIEYIDHLKRSYFEYVWAFLNPFNQLASHDDEYRDYLYDVIIKKVKEGIPIILGIKIYPDQHFFWDNDHFVLLVGYNEDTNELIFNDFNKRKRIKADKLLDKTDGYSIVNRYNFHNYIEISDF